MKKFLFYLNFTALLTACTSKNKLPEGVLPREKMQIVVWDLVQAGEFLDAFEFSQDTTIDRKVRAAEWYDRVFALHKVTRESFEKSYAYYKEHPMLMKQMMDSLSKKTSPRDTSSSKLDSLAKIDSATKGAFKLRDSLRKRRLLDLPKDEMFVK
jgi:hypothetical protein